MALIALLAISAATEPKTSELQPLPLASVRVISRRRTETRLREGMEGLQHIHLEALQAAGVNQTGTLILSPLSNSNGLIASHRGGYLWLSYQNRSSLCDEAAEGDACNHKVQDQALYSSSNDSSGVYVHYRGTDGEAANEPWSYLKPGERACPNNSDGLCLALCSADPNSDSAIVHVFNPLEGPQECGTEETESNKPQETESNRPPQYTRGDEGPGSTRYLGCFDRELATACRTHSEHNASQAYEDCYRYRTAQHGDLVYMDDLSSGDRVLTMNNHGQLEITRVLVNQHRTSLTTSTSMLTLHTVDGRQISLTADHAIFAPGELVQAGELTIGSTLATGEGRAIVSLVERRMRDATVINPVTASGTILAGDGFAGKPILVATSPMWVAPYMLAAHYSLSHIVCRAFPEMAQEYYDAFTRCNTITSTVATVFAAAESALPSALLFLILAIADVALAIGFCACAMLAIAPKLAATAMFVAAGFTTVLRREQRHSTRRKHQRYSTRVEQLQ